MQAGALALAAASLGGGCAKGLPPLTAPVSLGEDLTIKPLADGVYLHVSRDEVTQMPANGLIVATGDGLVLVDTGWTNAQVARTVNWAEKFTGRRVNTAIVSHSHNDRMGGAEELRGRSITLQGSDKTAALLADRGQPGLDKTFSGATTLKIGGVEFQLFHPGHGHSPDNIVVWLPASHILFGGCLIKDATAPDLGNVVDADIASWNAITRVLLDRYPDARIVVPGHGPVGDRTLLDKTLAMTGEIAAKAAQRSSAP